MTYDAVEFWNNREHPNSSNNDDWGKQKKQLHENFIESCIKGCKVILDFGSGKGGSFRLYDRIGIEEIVSYDITETFKKATLEEGSKYSFSHRHIVNKVVIPNLPFEENYFDFVVCCHSLQHSRPEHIEDVMKELVRVGKVLVSIDFRKGGLPSIVSDKAHWFNHNYKDICKRHGWKFKKINYIEIFNQLQYTVKGEIA